MNEYAIVKLTQMLIEEDFNSKKEEKIDKYIVSKKELLQFCIKLLKEIEKVKE